MVEGTGPANSGHNVPRVRLVDIEPPGKQTDITWMAIKEGVREIFIPDIDDRGTPAIVVLPHRIQATFVCRKCLSSATAKFYTADVIRGHIAITKKCGCHGNMYRKFLGAERDVPVEVDGSSMKKPRGLEMFFEEDDQMDEDDDGLDQ